MSMMELFCKNSGKKALVNSSKEVNTVNYFLHKISNIYVWEGSNYATLTASLSCIVNKITKRFRSRSSQILLKCSPVFTFFKESLRWLDFKISDSKNWFKNISAIALTHSQSLITFNSHNNKQVWRYIHLLKICSNIAFL